MLCIVVVIVSMRTNIKLNAEINPVVLTFEMSQARSVELITILNLENVLKFYDIFISKLKLDEILSNSFHSIKYFLNEKRRKKHFSFSFLLLFIHFRII